jgi:CRISPR/Cas system-associated exonuclease Cas4 (RecB family)
MPFSCEEYREQQQLIALKKRLAEIELKPEDREELERLVKELERKLKL